MPERRLPRSDEESSLSSASSVGLKDPAYTKVRRSQRHERKAPRKSERALASATPAEKEKKNHS